MRLLSSVKRLPLPHASSLSQELLSLEVKPKEFVPKVEIAELRETHCCIGDSATLAARVSFVELSTEFVVRDFKLNLNTPVRLSGFLV